MSKRLIAGQLYVKRDRNEWKIRDFSFDPTTRILQYSWKGEVKGAVITDNLLPVKIINNVKHGKYAIEVFCYKVEAAGDISCQLRRFVVTIFSA